MEASCLVSAGQSSAVWGPLTHMCLPGAAGVGVTGHLPLHTVTHQFQVSSRAPLRATPPCSSRRPCECGRPTVFSSGQLGVCSSA